MLPSIFQQYLKLAPASDKAAEVKGLIDKESQAFAATLPSNAEDDSKLQADNALLKKQLDDATATITQLQAKLGKHHHDLVAAPTPDVSAPIPPTPAVTTDTNAPGATPPAPLVADATDAAASTNAAPAGPQRALPLDSTNFLANATAPPPAEPSGPTKTYKVIKGDSYWKIAKKMYPGDTKNGVEKIQDANKETVGKPLKIGQVLIIPQ